LIRRPYNIFSAISSCSLEKEYTKFQGAIPIFDSGIGSYGVVVAMQRSMPHVPLVYLADRASFPYGTMPLYQLQNNIQKRIEWLSYTFSPTAIILASNTPSMTVFEDLRSRVPLVGIFPPIEDAAAQTETGHIGLLGTPNLLKSDTLKTDIKRAHMRRDFTIIPVDASALIAHMESFLFIREPQACKQHLTAFFSALFQQHPEIDTLLFASTHLSFLKPLILDLYPKLHCVDPAEAVAKQVAVGLKGRTPLFPPENTPAPLLILTTENTEQNLHVKTFKTGLKALGCTAPIHCIEL